MKKQNRLGAHFWLNCVTAALAVIAIVAYIIGAVGFAYYDDLNGVILAIGAAAVAASVCNGLLTRKLGQNVIFSVLGVLIGAALAACTMMIAEARVYSIAVLLFSELEKDNVEGYNALYCSLAAMGLFLAAAGCNIASNFCGVKTRE